MKRCIRWVPVVVVVIGGFYPLIAGRSSESGTVRTTLMALGFLLYFLLSRCSKSMRPYFTSSNTGRPGAHGYQIGTQESGADTIRSHEGCFERQNVQSKREREKLIREYLARQITEKSWGITRFVADIIYGMPKSPWCLLIALGLAASTVGLSEIVSYWINGYVWTRALISIVFLIALTRAAWWIARQRILRRYPFPVCANGVCRLRDDYRWRVGTVYGREGRRYYRYWCQCGDEYIRKGQQIFRIDADGSEHLYACYNDTAEIRYAGEVIKH